MLAKQPLAFIRSNSPVWVGHDEISLSMPGGFGGKPWFFSMCSSSSTWSLTFQLSTCASSHGGWLLRQTAEVAWLTKAWPRTGFHHILLVNASHRAARHLAERKQTPPLGGRSGVRLQELGARMFGTSFSDNLPHSVLSREL